MPNPKEITHYCTACQKEHTFIENEWPFWNSKEVNGETIYWCNKGIDCAGCKKVHKRNGITKSKEKNGTTLWICAKWINGHGNGEIDWDMYSPQEVMSGVHLGMKRDKVYGEDTENHDIVHAEEVKAVDQELTELEELEAEDRLQSW